VSDERAVRDALERRDDLLAGLRQRDDGARPLADRLTRCRDAAPVRGIDRVCGGPRMRERIEHHAASRRVGGRVDVCECGGERGAEAIEWSRERERFDGCEGEDPLSHGAHVGVKSNRWSWLRAKVDVERTIVHLEPRS